MNCPPKKSRKFWCRKALKTKAPLDTEDAGRPELLVFSEEAFWEHLQSFDGSTSAGLIGGDLFVFPGSNERFFNRFNAVL
jgi:hypothetical protein